MNHRASTHRTLGRALAIGAIFTLTACANDAQTGAAVGAGLGAIAGQAIGGDTEGTLIGAAIGAGTGYVVGNERERARERHNPGGRNPDSASDANPLADTEWRVLSLTGDQKAEDYASMVVDFQTADTVTTYTTYQDGQVETTTERYSVDGSDIVFRGAGYTVDGTYDIDGDTLTISAPNFNAVMERLSG